MATPTTSTGWILRVGSYAGIADALRAVDPCQVWREADSQVAGVARTSARSKLTVSSSWS